MYEQEVATDLRIINVTSVAGATILRNLVNDAFAAKSGDAAKQPPGSILKVVIFSAVALTVSDSLTTDGFTLAANTRYEVRCLNPLGKLRVAGIGTVTVELYYGR